MFELNETNWHFESAEPCEGIMADTLKIDKDFSALARWISREEAIEPGKAYAFAVRCRTSGVRNPVSPYAMLTFLDASGKIMLRAYASNVDEAGEVKRIAFNAEENWLRVRVELGLRGTGCVAWARPQLEETAIVPARRLRIGTMMLQSEPTCEQTLARMEEAIDRAAIHTPDLLMFSELLYDHADPRPLAEKAEGLDGPQCRSMRERAARYGVYILVDVHEKDRDGRLYNTAVLFDRQGNLAARYRKTHLSTGEYEKGLTPGDELPVFDTEFGKIGILICWDAYFPEPARVLALKGAELLLISTVGDPGYRHISRAKENGVYVAVAGAQHSTPGIMTSKIISPEGRILAQADESGACAMADIDLSNRGRIYWLSVPGTEAIPENIYRNERREELYAEV